MQTETLQDQFLNRLRKERMAATVFLMNGFQIRCVITGFDPFVVTVNADGKTEMIYKHAISTIIPAGHLD
ncbi:MAG: RNA chaperone Hfq [Oscillospiraceae bacterium]|nr:RNA chaperone Hfq [Oscillospiraceae bacterium]